MKSIYEISGARTCSIELRSFSKQASFTGIRCSYYVVPNEIFPDIKDHIDFFETLPEYDVDMYNNKKSKCNPEVSLSILNDVLPILEGVSDFTNDTLFATLSEYNAIFYTG